jgi:thiol-disulfide isomerase/thioredoxin
MKRMLLVFCVIAACFFCGGERLLAQSSYLSDSVKRKTTINPLREADFMNERINAIIGKQFSAFEGKTMAKTIFSSKELQGKTVFVNFWFSGCEPCMKEMPALNKLYDTLKNDSSFVFLSLTFDPIDLATRVIKLFDIKYPVTMISEAESHRLNNIGGYPTSLLLDKNGVMRWAAVGGIEHEIATGELVNSIYPKVASQP